MTEEQVAKLSQERRLHHAGLKDKKMMKKKYPGNKDWKKGMNSPNPAGRPKGQKNKFSKRIRDLMKIIYEQNLLKVEMESENYTPMQRLKVLETIGKFVVEEKKSLKKEINTVSSIEITFKKEADKPIPIENKNYQIEDAEEIEDYE